MAMKKAHLIPFFSILSILFISGCISAPTTTIEANIGENKAKIATVENRLDTIDQKLEAIEANQLTAEDILTITEQQVYWSNDGANETNPQPGCPSAHDVNVKWFNEYSEGSISKRQYDKIVNKYNSEECK